ncbi:APSES transcription factor [Trichophyton tonsurans CBS 112818]|uniref:Cell pattern formation-associated protein stuA n=1 Tax=Trichophyton tonsurans (strain CBS 112818) TaxID=647933 RepID=F2S0M2_TRIT1|nr:APSES transcription factor [Trichophyton tonsurans CBS 112818]
MASSAGNEGHIYSATYSNVPVYEYKLGTENVMRRRVDDWVNATHILKAAGLDKPSRTRILERDVQRGVHEKIQGGYGKYQGTWIPLAEARALADKNNVLDRLRPLFDFMTGDTSPPPAPKHSTAASKPRTRGGGAGSRRGAAGTTRGSFSAVGHHIPPVPPAAPPANSAPASFNQEPQQHQQQHQQYGVSQSFNETSPIMQGSPEASSLMADEDLAQMSPESTQSRKRKRGDNGVAMSIIEQNHILYGDQLLDYFMTVGDDPSASRVLPPVPPTHFQVDRPIDDQGNTALHWACAMGDVDIVKDLISRGADVRVRSKHDETPLVRAVLFTNNYEKRTMGELADLLHSTITFRDWFGATVFNHLAATTRSKGKWKSSRYYCQTLIDKLSQVFPRHEISLLLSSQDANGDTAALTAAKNGCYRLATTLLAQCPEAGNLQNRHHETANEVLMALYKRRKENPPPPSSVTYAQDMEGDVDYAVTTPTAGNYTGSAVATEATNALLVRIGSIMAEANRRLARAYGEAKTPPHSSSSGTGVGEDMTNPKGLYEQLESDRENIRSQIEALQAKEEESEDVDAQLARFNEIKAKYESLLNQAHDLELTSLYESNGITEDTGDSDANHELAPEEMLELYTLANELAQAQADRDEAVAQLIRQRADAGVSTKLDVHRKLVSLATGLAEEELDPMSSELADALEFDRANEKRSGPAPSTARQLMATGEPDPESPGTRSRSVSRNGHDGGNNNANETTNGLDNDHAVDASSVAS